ncbi:MAG: right-handed parallel beta-helix repeat-containing protein [Planctomycetota bacterium]
MKIRFALLLLFALLPARLGAQCVTVVQGPVVGPWTAAESPYCVVANVTAPRLTIEAGVEVRVAPGASIVISGALTAIGTESAPIVFGALDAGGWLGLEVRGGAGTVLEHCRVGGSSATGLTLIDSPATLRHCRIEGNSAVGDGGGLVAQIAAGDLLLTDCAIVDNACAMFGGGIRADLASGRLVLDRCELRGNQVVTPVLSGVDVGGGALFCSAAQEVAFTDCVIEDNQVAATCSGCTCFAIGSGGGVAVRASDLRMTRCLVLDNRIEVRDSPFGGCSLEVAVGRGGGVYFDADGCAARLDNCVFAGNGISAMANGTDAQGAGVFADGGVAELRNVTVVRNCAASRGLPTVFPEAVGGVRIRQDGAVVNSIVYGNVNSIGWASVTSDPQIFGARVVVTYSDVQNGFPGVGNIHQDPLLAGEGTWCGAVEIGAGSPAIDAGNPARRFADVAFPPSLGGSRNDMGANGGALAEGWRGWERGALGLRAEPTRAACGGARSTLVFAVSGGAMTAPVGVFLEAVGGTPLPNGPVWLPVPAVFCAPGRTEIAVLFPVVLCTAPTLTFRAYGLRSSGGLVASSALTW